MYFLQVDFECSQYCIENMNNCEIFKYFEGTFIATLFFQNGRVEKFEI